MFVATALIDAVVVDDVVVVVAPANVFCYSPRSRGMWWVNNVMMHR